MGMRLEIEKQQWSVTDSLYSVTSTESGGQSMRENVKFVT